MIRADIPERSIRSVLIDHDLASLTAASVARSWYIVLSWSWLGSWLFKSDLRLQRREISRQWELPFLDIRSPDAAHRLKKVFALKGLSRD